MLPSIFMTLMNSTNIKGVASEVKKTTLEKGKIEKYLIDGKWQGDFLKRARLSEP